MTHNCRKCGIELDTENWSPSHQKSGSRICKECIQEYNRLYLEANRDKINARKRLYREVNHDELNAKRGLHREANRDKLNAQARLLRKNNPDKAKASDAKHRRKNGVIPFDKNKGCSSYYGVYINEGLLKLYFDDVEVMPYGHKGYDFVCNNGWKIDGKGSFTGDKGHWMFTIRHNTTADYFFCVAYDNCKDRNIIHIWMIPGHILNHLSAARISKSTLLKWAKYEQPIGKAILCCDSMKDEA